MRSARVAALTAAATAAVLLVVPPVFAANTDAQPPDDVPGAVTIVGVALATGHTGPSAPGDAGAGAAQPHGLIHARSYKRRQVRHHSR